jgi:hypothetical protein
LVSPLISCKIYRESYIIFFHVAFKVSNMGVSP